MGYNISCACGAVEGEVSGEAVMQVYCHCQDCRDWLGAPVHAATVWPEGQVRLTKGADKVITYARTPKSLRKSCGSCGGALMVEHPEAGVVDVMASRLQGFAFAPSFHVFYGERMIAFPDELPKFITLPKEAGGTGELA